MKNLAISIPLSLAAGAALSTTPVPGWALFLVGGIIALAVMLGEAFAE